MTLRSLALAGVMALACALPAAAQSSSTFPVKDSSSTTRNLAGQADAAGAFHYRDIMEGLTAAGAPDAFLSDGSGHQLVTLFGTPSVSISNTPTVNIGSIGGGATASAQGTAQTSFTAMTTAQGTPADAAYTGSNTATFIALLKAQLAVLQTPTAAATASNIAPAQGSVTTTAASLVAARAGRRSVTIENTGTTPVYIGGSGVTSTTGFLLPGVAGASVTLNFSGAVYAVTASGTAAVTLYEIY